MGDEEARGIAHRLAIEACHEECGARDDVLDRHPALASLDGLAFIGIAACGEGGVDRQHAACFIKG